MLHYTDIHCHMLSGTDDGARTDEEMFAMLDAAYASGTRSICLTPHFNPMRFGDNRERGERAYEKLCAYAHEKYPDMYLSLGNELFYHFGCTDRLNEKSCRTLGGSRYVLVEFDFGTSMYEMERALKDLLSSGYIPVFAHVERYGAVKPPFRELERLKDMGVLIQINSTSLCGGWGRGIQRKTVKLLRRFLPDILAGDAHDTVFRHPRLDECEQILTGMFGTEYTRALMCDNPAKIIAINLREVK
ncbi:MAG: CpsB/CapC family capsule biosynthesis tyrosine phosphatase [Eubacteriales bacterium]|nr:CpsB/CapC family capsule biosynthesis tyrosine phosphatase [Eubacteriales bacterium]